MKCSTESALVSFWRMGRNATQRGMDVSKLCADIRSAAAQEAFLRGSEGKPRPTLRREKSTGRLVILESCLNFMLDPKA